MARLTAPLMSLTASGTIGKALTYGSWKGVHYARTRVVPQNPKSVGQTETREVWKTINSLWKAAPLYWTEIWEAAIAGLPLTARNLLMLKNLPALRSQANLAALVFSPGMASALPPATVTFTAGAGQITLACTAPTSPTGWTLVAARFYAVQDGDPAPAIERTVQADRDTTAPYSVVITGLPTSLHRCAAVLEWTAPDASTRYSLAVTGSATPT